MKKVLFSFAFLAALFAGPVLHGQDSFRVRVDQPQHGKVTVTPAIPESGMVPAGTVLNVKVEVTDPEEKVCRVTVPDYQLSLAIGNKGQNARLAAKLTGYKIDIRPESGYYGEED